MKPGLSILLSVLLSCGVAAGISSSIRTGDSAASETTEAIAPNRLEQLESSLSKLREEQARLTQVLDRIASQGALQSPERVSVGEIERLVNDAFLHRAQAQSAEHANGAQPEVELLAEHAKEEIFAEIFGVGLEGKQLDSAERQLAWNKLTEAGLAEEALAWFETMVDDDPNDPDKRVQLGEIYLLSLQEVGNGPMAGVLASKADKSFDAALDIDQGHWGARFNKAVALSFWPPVFGKQSEAIQQFEHLVDLQGQRTSSPEHAQTHLLLGNMYQQLGQQAKAIEAWQVGVQRFPGNESLAKQLSLAQDS
ncbi:MAG: tetratricopeptide (TPR) repeat protein [Planctomycetota bacterium]|jgi:tetratricopeptide (TPR) repeat protein